MADGRARVRVGVDLDGTVIRYDRLFHQLAAERFAMPDEIAATKLAVRSWVRTSAVGEPGWIELQRLAYGSRIEEAEPSPGVARFLDTCRTYGARVSIISHKTRFSVAAPPIDLHAAALGWLSRHGFFAGDGSGLNTTQVFFEATRAAKLSRIASERCTIFIDDLEEVLSEPAFPAWTERWLLSDGSPAGAIEGVTRFCDWDEVARRVLALTGVQGAL